MIDRGWGHETINNLPPKVKKLSFLEPCRGMIMGSVWRDSRGAHKSLILLRIGLCKPGLYWNGLDGLQFVRRPCRLGVEG